MPKEHKYSILDREYFWALGKVFETMAKTGINGVLVGGLGVQVAMADAVSKGSPLEDHVNELSLRKTDDFDIVASVPESQMEAFLSRLESGINETDSQGNVYELSMVRKGTKRPRILVTAATDDYVESEIMMNFSLSPADHRGTPRTYYDQLNTCRYLNLNYKGNNIQLAVASPEHLIAGKILRYAPRDIEDIVNLCSLLEKKGTPVDFEQVRSILTSYNSDDLNTHLERWSELNDAQKKWESSFPEYFSEPVPVPA